MKIAYVGNFTQRHCTEVHLAATLESMGHEVLRLQENEVSEGALSSMIAATPIDVFLYTRTWGKLVTLEHLEQLRERKIPSVSYHLDLYVGLERKYLHENKTLEEILQNDPFWRTDYVFTPDGDPESAKVFQANGVKHYYQRAGVYEPECYRAQRIEENHKPLIFVGGGDRPGSPHIYGHPEWNYRNELVTWLWDTYGDRFTKFGHPQQTIRNEALNQLYADTDIVIGDSVCVGFTHQDYWSDRVYETIGRGGFLIHPFIKGLEEEFTDKEHIVFYEYGNFLDLRQKIDYYLMYPAEREQIRQAGFELVKSNYTYTHRLQKMLDTVFHEIKSDVESVAAVPTPSVTDLAPDKINLGSGNDPLEGYCNVDMLEREDVDIVHNLMNFPYPFGDNSAISIKAIDLIEHLDHYTKDDKPTIMAFMEECGRILKPGGELYIQTPSWDSELFKIDPTHVRGFHPKSFDFFDEDKWYGQIREFYGGPKFSVTCKELENKNLQFTMVKK
jgi:SAM-dependent methyltransferase